MHVPLIHRWFDELCNQGNEATIDNLMTDNVIAHGLAGVDVVGKDQFREFHRGFRSALPAVHTVVDQVLEDGDHVAFRARIQVETTAGEEYSFDGGFIIRLENGRFAEAWNQRDFGQASSPASPGAAFPRGSCQTLLEYAILYRFVVAFTRIC